MSDESPEFDLKFLPDWLKETPAQNRYADYEGESGERPRREREDRGSRGPRPDRRGPPPPRGADRRGPGADRPAGGRGPRPGGNRDRENRPQDRGRDQAPPRDAVRPPPRPVAEVRVDFIPEPAAAAGIARQIKASGRAYAVFNTSKLFLDRPERHRVRVTSADPAIPLFQLGDGPATFDRAVIERDAFRVSRDDFYAEDRVEGEPIKGNFTNVARSRSTGALLGPTNHHGYQPALRKLYDERFSRRMPFPEFQRDDIEIVTGEQVVADWKEQARATTTFTTTKEAEPITFKTLAEAEQHFRKTYLPGLVKSGASLECSGPASRAALDRHVSVAIRQAWESESRFPQQIVNALRPYFSEVGLQFFKHRKRLLFVSAVKPVRHPAGQIFSDGIAAILRTLEATPRLKRPQLAAKILGPQPAAEIASPAAGAASAEPALEKIPHEIGMETNLGPDAPEVAVSVTEALRLESIETRTDQGSFSENENAVDEIPTPAAAAEIVEATEQEPPASENASSEFAGPSSVSETAKTDAPVSPPPAPEPASRKAQLAADLHYLLRAGHVIEFADGSLDLPLAPQPPQAPQPKIAPRPAPQKNSQTEPVGEPVESEDADADAATAALPAVSGESASVDADAAAEQISAHPVDSTESPRESGESAPASAPLLESAGEVSAAGLEDTREPLEDTERATLPAESVSADLPRKPPAET